MVFGKKEKQGSNGMEMTFLGKTKEEMAKASAAGERFGGIFSKQIIMPVKNAGTHIKDFNTSFDASTKTLDEFCADIDDADGSLKRYLSTVKPGEATLDGYNASLKGATASSVGLSVATTLLNSAISLGVGLLIQFAVAGLQKLINADQDAIDKANELSSSYASASGEISSNLKSLSGMTNEFQKLSAGVDDYGNNISLSSEEYARYKDIVQQILDISPSLITGWDSEGNALANKNQLIEASIQLQKEKLRLEQEEITSSDKLWELQKGYNAKYRKMTGKVVETDQKGSRLFRKIIAQDGRDNLLGNSTDAQKFDYLEKEFGSDAFGYLNIDMSKDSERLYQLIKDNDLFRDEDINSLKEYISERKRLESELNAQSSKLNPILQQIPQTLTAYDTLTGAQKNFMAAYINGFKITPENVDNQDAMNEMRQQIIDMTQMVADDDQIQEAIKGFFALDSSALAAADWQRQAESYITSIAQRMNADPDAMMVQFGVKVETNQGEIVSTVAQMIGAISDKLNLSADDIGSLSIEELKLAYTNLADVGTVSFDELKGKIEEYRDAVNTATVSINASFEELSSQLDDLQSAFSSLYSAVSEYNDTGSISVDTMQSLLALGPQYTALLFDENGKINLNTKAIQDLTAARTEDLAIKKASGIVDSLANYKSEEEAIRNLSAATSESTAITRESVLAKLADLELNDKVTQNVKDLAKARISEIFALADSAKKHIYSGNEFSGSSGQSAADRMAAEFQKAYSQIQYLRDRGVISEQEYLDRLFELNERYNKDNAETWQKYDLELFNGRQKLLEQQLKAQGQAYSDAIDKQVEKLQEQKRAEQEHYDDLIQAQQEKLAGLEEEWQAQDALLELERRKIALENAQKQRNALVYRKDQGFVWEADPEAVESAQEDLAQAQQDFERDQAKKEINDHIKALQQEKKATEENLDRDIEKWTELKDSVQENMSHIGETLTEHQEQMTLLAEAEAMSFDQMAAAAQNYANSVEDALQRVLDAKAQFAGKESSDRVISTSSSYQKNSVSNVGSNAVNSAIKAANELRRSQLNSEIYSLTQQISMLERQYNAMKLGSPAAAGDVMKKIEKLRSDMSKARSELNSIPKYASGTRNARGGLAIVNESGQETILPRLRSGNYAMLGAGDIVLNAEQTRRFQDLLGAPHGFAAENIAKSIQSMTTRIPNVGIPAARTVEEYTFNISKLEFPGVGTAEEIKRALMTLPNRAKQTMYRRK